MTKTRYPELFYRQDAINLWRIVDADGSAVGPQYATKMELLADLDRYARVFGATGAEPYRPEVEQARHEGRLEGALWALRRYMRRDPLDFPALATIPPTYEEQARRIVAEEENR